MVTLLGGTGGRTAGHRWVHCWAQVGALLGTGGCTAGHRWVHCWAQVGGTCVWHCWAPIIRALVISDPDGSDSVRKVQPRTGICIFPVISVSLDTADH
ncbi:unnamed protein product, partial [Staurois parvus]